MEVLNMGRDEENRKKWFKDNVFRYVLDLNRAVNKNVIEKLESVPSKKQYIVSLIEQDIENEKSANH